MCLWEDAARVLTTHPQYFRVQIVSLWSITKIALYTLLEEKGKESGKWLYFSDEGKLVREVNYQEGTMHGTLTEFRDGRIFFTIPYVNGKKSGLYRSYNYVCGTLASEGFFKDDKMEGLCYEYYKAILIEITEYKEGERVKTLYTHPKIKLSELPGFPDSNCFSSSTDYDEFKKN